MVDSTSNNGTILERIVATRRQRIAELSDRYDVASLQAQLQPSQRSLFEALAKPESGFILECKKASPSKGLIRADFSAADIARVYQRYAAAISVLTEPDYFQGSFHYLTAVSAAVDIPVLCKDFIVTELQVVLARYYGADAILLMLSVLSDAEYKQLAELAARYHLDVLTEVSTSAEMDRANALGAKIIGINNRNLHDLSIDPNRSIELSAEAHTDALVIAESGFSHHLAVRQTAPFVDGFLVGSALSAQADIDQACRELIYGSHKVCGLGSADDAQVVRAAGGVYGGLIFVPESPRAVTAQQAQEIIEQQPQLQYVGVVQNLPVAEAAELARALNLSALQLHGQEDHHYIEQLRSVLPTNCEIWKALGVQEKLAKLPDLGAVDRFVLDNKQGGSGQAFAWEYLAELTLEERQQALLAGGVGVANLSAALTLNMAGLDLNSSVEHAPGKKDPAQIKLIFERIRAYGRKQHED